jgi:hypothetical protein
MTINQLFFAFVGVLLTAMGFCKYYLDAKVDGVRDSLNAKMDAKFETVSARFDGVNQRIDGLASDIRALMTR